jgi:hypothetical protein
MNPLLVVVFPEGPFIHSHVVLPERQITTLQFGETAGNLTKL